MDHNDQPKNRLRQDALSIFHSALAAFDPEEDHWTKLAEIEPVVAPYGSGETFDGWIVLPVLGGKTSYALVGSGFDPRARLQIRASAYFVA